MFTGIIEKIGLLTINEPTPQGARWTISTGFLDLVPGESVAVNGVCLTVTESDTAGSAQFYLSSETLARSHFSKSKANDRFNLERALQLGSRLSGHWVQGHVDGIGILEKIESKGDCYELTLSLDRSLSKYCVQKGSIAINGVSLTLNEMSDTSHRSIATLMIIPHTWKHTQLGDLKPGSLVNIETDILAKYAARSLEVRHE